jgi:hypothetical protein
MSETISESDTKYLSRFNTEEELDNEIERLYKMIKKDIPVLTEDIDFFKNARVRGMKKVEIEQNSIVEEQNSIVEVEENLGKESDKDYISVVKKVKKENITPDNIAEIMLCQIPGISSVTAVAIMDRFKTIPNLIQEIQQNDNCLKDLSYQNTKGQTRKINKTSLANIVKFLLKK